MIYHTIAPPLGEFTCNPPLNSEAGNQIAADIVARQADPIAWHPEATEAERDDATEIESRRWCPELPPGRTFDSPPARAVPRFGMEVFLDGEGKKVRAEGARKQTPHKQPQKKSRGVKLSHAQAMERMRKQ